MYTAKELFAKSKKWLSSKNNEYFQPISLIKKIDEISVICYVIVKVDSINFSVVSKYNGNHGLFDYTFELESFSIKSIELFINKIKQIIGLMKFDQELGVFHCVSNGGNGSKNDKNNGIKLKKAMFVDVFGFNYIDKEKCIGECGSNTINKLSSCGHFCCLRCWEKIYKNSEQKCPVCLKHSCYLDKIFDYYISEKYSQKTIIQIEKELSNDLEIESVHSYPHIVTHSNASNSDDYEDEDSDDYEDEDSDDCDEN